jgi:hypothetical protein
LDIKAYKSPLSAKAPSRKKNIFLLQQEKSAKENANYVA